jgi:hypothetical protein
MLATSVTFNFIIFCLILLNAVTLAVYTYDQSEEKESFINQCNVFFTWIFVAEMIVKLIGLGFKNYIKDNYNLFDAVIVILSLVDWTISQMPAIDAGSAL